jgi:hypothetical protein
LKFGIEGGTEKMNKTKVVVGGFAVAVMLGAMLPASAAHASSRHKG